MITVSVESGVNVCQRRYRWLMSITNVWHDESKCDGDSSSTGWWWTNGCVVSCRHIDHEATYVMLASWKNWLCPVQFAWTAFDDEQCCICIISTGVDNWGVEIETPKATRGNGETYQHPHAVSSRLGGLGSVVSSPSETWAELGRNRFWCILTLKEPIWRQENREAYLATLCA